MSRGEQLGVGDEAAQYRRLRHASEKHGLAIDDCDACGGSGLHAQSFAGHRALCPACGGDGFVVRSLGDATPCGPDCPMNELRSA